MLKQKITMNIQAEFYPNENELFQRLHAGLSESEQFERATAMVMQLLSENSANGLWFSIELEEEEDPIVWQSTIRKSMVENLSADEVAQMIDDLNDQVVRGTDGYDLED